MSNPPPPTSNHRSVTGVVTKLVGDGATYGFINDEIFFQQTNVTGGPASIGDQIYAECEYSANLPIKWNATSVRIVGKSVGQPQVPNTVPVTQTPQQPQNPRPQIQQPFNQAPAQVAMTYQQHRQQRMQRQGGEVEKPHDSSINTQHQNAPRLLDQGLNQGEFFSVNDPRAAFNQQNQAQQQQLGDNIAPFQDQPMGPPKFAYTSQLGSAFIQNQFATPPPPFITQQPTPLLPQNQHQRQQSPQQQGQVNQRQQHRDGGRFNQGDKNEVRQNRRGNRNERGRSKDRANDDKRDRSARGNKREDTSARQSSPLYLSTRSSTSVSSDRGSKAKRHYDAQNIPKTKIMMNMDAYNMKQRCPSSVHVPSDLKEVIVNQYYRLDIKNTPKPIKFTIEKPTSDEKYGVEISNNESCTDADKKTTEGDTSKTVENAAEFDPETQIKSEKDETKAADQATPPSSKSDTRLNHKYGVKVMLLSLPDFKEIYHDVYGENLDSYSSEVKPKKRVVETVSLLCNQAANNGYSLVGGKFDPVLDGFIEGANNEFERHGRQPDLIATCKRVVQEQTGLDLGPCKSWTLLSTFIYNNRSEYFSSKASVEYSFIYVPQIWSMTSENTVDKSIIIDDEQEQEADEPTESREETNETVDDSVVDQAGDAKTEPVNAEALSVQATLTTENLSDLKVADLKIELDKRDVKYKPSAKKAELAALLRDFLEASQLGTANQDAEPKLNTDHQSVDGKEDDTLKAETDISNHVDTTSKEGSTGKRKSEDAETGEDIENTKKARSDSGPVKREPVALIKDSFIVRGKSDPQLSTISLHAATLAGRHDQFELSVASNILKESLTQHFSEYILTALVEDYRERLSSSGGGSNPSSQDSDSNNNKSASKNPTSEVKINLKELPADRYINLAFSYFDTSHIGHLYFEDLFKIFTNTGLTISKRALIALIGEGEKYHYRSLPDKSSKIAPSYVYEFPKQFSTLPGLSRSESDQPVTTAQSKTIEHKGVFYDVDKLVQQASESEITRVNLYERFNHAIANSDKQHEEIHVLEVNQKSLAKAIKAQNDEICELKKERDSLKKTLSNARKVMSGVVTSLSDFIKEGDKGSK